MLARTTFLSPASLAVALFVVAAGCADAETSWDSGLSTAKTSPTAAIGRSTTTTDVPAATTSQPDSPCAAHHSRGPDDPTLPMTTPYVVPVADVAAAGWGTTHSAYPATDVFLACGSALVSPVNGTLLEVRRLDGWSAAVDNPATRGGRSISIRGDDGVRYYMAHFDTIDASLEPGVRVAAGQPLGTMGTTGRSSACHLHFGISPECPGREWSVRRGAVWPYPYLDAWSRGEQLSPVDEVTAWSAANPDACALAMADPFAADS
jgi:hypothetical protein